MNPATVSLAFVILSLVFCCTAGGSFVLMGLELKRKGRPTQFLSLSFKPSERLRVARGVFESYRQLKQEEGSPAVLPVTAWVSVVAVILCFALSLIALVLQ